jgi:Zn-dependent M28 family amino/carboxypeptidase
VRRALAALLVVATSLTAAVLIGQTGDHGERQSATNAAQPTPEAPATPSGDPAVHLRTLARAARANGNTRAAGTPGAEASEDYVAQALRAAGYEVRRQRVPFPFFDERRPPRVRVQGRTIRARTMAYSPGGTVSGEVAAVGLACTRQAFVKLEQGQVALADRGVCPFRRKARLAQAAGAAAILVADTGADPVSATLGAPGLAIPALAIGAPGARTIERADNVTIRVDAVSERRVTHNVIGERPNSPTQRVILGAHLDSVPAGPGMNDNASGAAAVLAAAERLARTDDANGVRVAFWGAEELGLYGSRRYVDTLSARERRRIVAYLNLDMVGTPDGTVRVYDTDEDTERILRAATRAAGRTPGEEDLDGNSDHAPFARAGIPVGGLFTGLDRCYHRACDGPGNVDGRLVDSVAEAVARAARGLLERA